MTPEELSQQPWPVACKILMGMLPKSMTDKLALVEVPEPVRVPRYDRKVYRKGGHQWASETDLDGLKFWAGRAEESLADGGQYAQQNQKQFDELNRWIAFREVYPTDAITITRGEDSVTAKAPSYKPEVWSKLPKDDIPEQGAWDDNEEPPF